MESILQLMVEYIRDGDVIDHLSTESIRKLNISTENEFTYLPPQLTKDVYYSLFVDNVLRMAFWSRGDIYTALEMVMCMVFTPSPSGWFEGIWMAFYSDDYA